MAADFSSVYIEQLIAAESIREALRQALDPGPFGESAETEDSGPHHRPGVCDCGPEEYAETEEEDA